MFEKTKNLTNKPKNNPINKLEIGPDMAINAASRIGFFRNLGSYGTGFAKPNIMVGCPKRAGRDSSNGKTTEPKGSKWGKGFKVRRPNDLAVESPK